MLCYVRYIVSITSLGPDFGGTAQQVQRGEERNDIRNRTVETGRLQMHDTVKERGVRRRTVEETKQNQTGIYVSACQPI
jgi:hypothetical protein